jgi:hypothetical protein
MFISVHAMTICMIVLHDRPYPLTKYKMAENSGNITRLTARHVITVELIKRKTLYFSINNNASLIK